MPLPADFNTVTLTGKFVNLQGDAITGTIQFLASPRALISDAHDTVIIPVVLEVNLDESGTFTAALPATTDPDINPQGWTYSVTESFPGGRSYSIELPVDGGPYELSELAPVPSSAGQAIVRGPGVAPGGTAGQVLTKASAEDFDTGWADPTGSVTIHAPIGASDPTPPDAEEGDLILRYLT